MADTSSLSELIADNYSVVSGLALIVWDALLCFGEEKRQIWERSISGSSLLYLVIRYGSLFEYAVETVDISPNVGVLGCLATIRLVAFPDFLRTVGLGLFSALRILAISGRNWTLFTIVFVLCVWPIGINTYQFATAVLVIDNTYHSGCAGNPPLSPLVSMIIQVLEDGTLIVAEFLVVIVTVKKTFKLRNREGAAGPRISRLLLRDGTILFLVLAALAGTDMFLVLITYFGPDTEFVQNLCLVQNLLVALRVVLVCRFILNLRAICYSDDGPSSSTAGSGTLNGRFTSKMIGTLGSSLRPSESQVILESQWDLFEEKELMMVSEDPFVMGLMMEDNGVRVRDDNPMPQDTEKVDVEGGQRFRLREFRYGGNGVMGSEGVNGLPHELGFGIIDIGHAT